MFKKFPDFTPALSNQREHGNVRCGVARHHPNQGALAYAAPAKNAHTLPAPASKQPVDGADAAAERLGNQFTLEGTRRCAVKIASSLGGVSASIVNCFTDGVEHARDQP